MKVTIEIDEDELQKAIIDMVAKECARAYFKRDEYKGIEKAVKEITDRPVFAGIIGPFSLAGRLMDVTEAMIYCYEDPDMVHTVLQKVTDFLIRYANAYKAAGAHGIIMAEPLAGLLSPALSQEFSCDYVKKIVDAVQDDNFLVIYHRSFGLSLRKRYLNGGDDDTYPVGYYRNGKCRSCRRTPQRHCGIGEKSNQRCHGRLLQISELCHFLGL